MSEHELGCWKRRSRKYSPGRPGEEPDDLDGKTVVPGDDANMLRQDTGPGGLVGEQVESRGVEAVSGKSGQLDTLYMDYIWWRTVPEVLYAWTKPLESIKADHAHRQWKEH